MIYLILLFRYVNIAGRWVLPLLQKRFTSGTRRAGIVAISVPSEVFGLDI